MKSRKKLRKRGLALFLSLIVCFSSLHLTAFAEDETGGSTMENVGSGGGGSTTGEGDTTGGGDAAGGSDTAGGGDTAEGSGTGSSGNEEASGNSGTDTGNSAVETGPHGGPIERDENGSKETWDTTDESGVKKSGIEVVVRSDNGTTVETYETVVTPLENGTKTEEAKDTKTETTNPTVTNPDGSTTTSGSDHTEGWGTSTTDTTTVTPDPDNPGEPVKPDEDEIAKGIEQDPSDPEKTPGQFDNPSPKVDPETGEPIQGMPIDPEDLSQKSDEWLGEDGITVDMQPDNEVYEANIQADVSDWRAVIQAKIDAAKPENSVPYTVKEAQEDQIDIPEGAKAWKSDDGTITIVTPTYDNDVLTGFTVQTFTTTEGEKKDEEDKGSAILVEGSLSQDDPVREENNKTTTYDFQLPEQPKEGSWPDENGNTVTTTVELLYSEERYIQQEDGTYILSDSDEALPVVVGYLTKTVTTDANGKEIASSSRSDWGVKNQMITTPIRTGNAAEWTVIVEHYTVPITRAITTNSWTLNVDLGTGEATCKVTGQMSEVRENTEKGHGEVSGETGLEVTVAPDAGPKGTDTDKDLHHRVGSVFGDGTMALIGLYKVTNPTLNVRTGPSTGHSKTGKPLENGAVVTVFEIQNGWGRIGEDNSGNEKWIKLDGYTQSVPIPEGNKAGTGKFIYLGQTGLESALLVNGEGQTASTWQPHQFVIYDDQGKPHYVYCADFEVSPKANTTYGEEIIDENTTGKWSDNASTNKEIAQKVQAIALNGYWGTSNGTGSLESVKQMMKDAIKHGQITGILESDVDKLTDGMALTATQAAIWSHATSGDKINVNNPFGKYNLNGTTMFQADAGFTENDRKITKALYDYLRNLEGQSSYKPNNEIKTIEGGSITVKSLAKVENGDAVIAPVVEGKSKTEDPAETANKYNTNVSFVLKTQPSQVNDDLLVTITDVEGKKIGTWRLSGDDKEDNTKGVIGKVIAGKDGTYTIEDVILAEGVRITLNLHGSQLADKSAYLITAQTPGGVSDDQLSQTFIGVKDQQRTVDLSVDLTFNVREPVASLNGTSITEEQHKTDEYKKEIKAATEWDTYEKEVVLTATSRYEYVSDSSWETTTPHEGDDDVDPGSDDDVNRDPGNGGGGTRPRPSRDRSNIADAPTPLAAIADEDVPLAMIPDEEVPLAEILDEDVPLAAVPKTGDLSGLWYVGLLFSALGLLVLSQKKREDA